MSKLLETYDLRVHSKAMLFMLHVGLNMLNLALLTGAQMHLPHT